MSPFSPRVFEQAEVAHPAAADGRYRRVVGEFWTARQKQMTPLHYLVSYRASFKPELPAYFIERLCPAGGVVYDPFCGRGTTALQANLTGRPSVGTDVNPLAVRIARAKCRPVPVEAVERRLAEVDWNARPESAGEPIDDLLPFYHPDTLRQLLNLRAFLARRRAEGVEDDTDRFIEATALSRLHGHSRGFFSVYSFPQISVPAKAQRRINERRDQKPDFRPVAERIVRKARRALAGLDIDALRAVSSANRFQVADAGRLSADQVPDASVDLIVTSPPFLAKADYLADNWLEFWFAGIDPAPLSDTLVQTPSLARWRAFVGSAMRQMARALRPGGHAVIEVGEVAHGGQVLHLDDVIVALAGEMSNVECRMSKTPALGIVEVLIHTQKFTKLANCFNVTNNAKGTNTQRMVVLRREE